MKKCPCCKEFKSEEGFGRDRCASDGLTSNCKQCRHDRYMKEKHNGINLLTCKTCGQEFEKKGRGRSPLSCLKCREAGLDGAWTLNCAHCNKEFTVRHQPKRKYCSNKCSGLSAGKTLYNKVCEYCGSDYTTTREEQKFCLSDCSSKSQRTLIGTIRECVVCGKEYEPTHKKQKCCSRDCQLILSNSEIIKGLAGENRLCGICGVEFTPIRINQEYCKKTCREKSFYQKNQDYFLNRRHIRRASPVDRFGQEVSMDELYEKANGLCGICGKGIDKNIEHPHPLSLSLDHILPISRGGLHTVDNVQLAHMSCNSKKGNRKFITNSNGQLMIV